MLLGGGEKGGVAGWWWWWGVEGSFFRSAARKLTLLSCQFKPRTGNMGGDLPSWVAFSGVVFRGES